MEDISLFGIPGMAAILICCLIIGMFAKNIKAINDKWIPVICGLFGAALGALGMNIMPDFPASNYITACAVGIVSGLASVGAHQVVKQLTKTDNYDELTYYKELASENETERVQMTKEISKLREELYGGVENDS